MLQTVTHDPAYERPIRRFNHLLFPDGAVIEIVSTFYGYNRRAVLLRLLSGDWPKRDHVLLALGADNHCGGGTLHVHPEGDTASATILGCD